MANELGFDINSSGLEKAAQASKDAAAGIKTVGDAAKTANESLKQTSDTLQKFGSQSQSGAIGKMATDVKQIDTAAKQASQSVAAMGAAINSAIGKSSSSAIFGDMALGIAKANTAIKEMPPALGAASSALNAHATAANNAANAHAGLSTQGLAAFHSVRSLTEQLVAGQLSVSSFAQQIGHLSYAASGPGGLMGSFGEVAKMLGAGGAIGAAIAVATTAFLGLDQIITSTAQKIAETRKRFDDLAGAKMGDQYADSLGKVSKSLGVARDAAQPAYESLIKIASLQGQIGGVQIFGNGQQGLTNATSSAEAFGKAISTAFEQFRIGNAKAEDATKGANEFFAALQKDAGLTGNELRKLQDESPQFAKALTNAFTGGAQTVQQFAQRLDKLPVSVNDVLRVLLALAPASDAAFKTLQENPKTVSDALTKLSMDFDKLWVSAGGESGSDRPTLVARGISAIGDAIVAASPTVANLSSKFAELETAISEGFVGKTISAIAGWEVQFAGYVVSGYATSLAATAGFVADSLGYLEKWGAQAISIAAKVGGAVANATANPGNVPASGNPAGDLSGGEGLEHFASGGSFVVGGNGGTDSQLIQFKATPGEKVTIEPPGGGSNAGGQTLGSLMPASSSAGGGSASSDLLSAHFANDLKTQTAALSDRINSSRDAIVVAVNNSAAKPVAGATGTASTASVPAIAAPPSGGSTSIAGSAAPAVAATASTVTGGKLSADQGFDPFDIKQAAQRAAQRHAQEEQDQPYQNFGGSTFAGQGTSFKGFQGNFLDNAQGAIGQRDPNQFGPLDRLDANGLRSGQTAQVTSMGRGGSQTATVASDQALKQQTAEWKTAQQTGSKTVADKVKEQGDKSDSIADKASGKLDGIESSGKAAADAAGSTKDATEENTKSLEGGFETANKLSEDQKAALEAGTDAQKEGTDATKQGTEDTKQAIDQGSQQGVNATQEGSNSIVNAVQALSESIVNGLSSAFQSVGETIASAVSNATAASSSGGQGSEGGSSSSGEGSSFAGGSFDVGSSPSSDVTDISPMADGGPVVGQGTGTSDSIPAMLSHGEFVVNAKQTAKHKALLRAINNDSIRHMADGGPATLGEIMGTPGNPGATADLVAAHFHEAEQRQTANIKDSVKTSQNAILIAINKSTAAIMGAIKSLGSSVSSAATASSAGSGSAGAAMTSTASGNFGNVTPNGSNLGVFGGSGHSADMYWSHFGLGPLARFATGGSFVVGGTGGTDSQNVQFKATPGERVTISPPGKNAVAPLLPANDDIPGSSFVPTMSMRPQSSGAAVGRVIPASDPSGHPDRNARNVNIFVQQGVQADTFVKSRAQIQRAMG